MVVDIMYVEGPLEQKDHKTAFLSKRSLLSQRPTFRFEFVVSYYQHQIYSQAIFDDKKLCDNESFEVIFGHISLTISNLHVIFVYNQNGTTFSFFIFYCEGAKNVLCLSIIESHLHKTHTHAQNAHAPMSLQKYVLEKNKIPRIFIFRGVGFSVVKT